MKKSAVVLLNVALFVAALLAFSGVAYSGFPPIVTTAPTPTRPPLETGGDFVVDIPDDALRAYLHLITGIPEANSIYKSDLAALTGGLDMSNRGISNAQGLQYCKNVTSIILEKNALGDGDLPSGMSAMTALKSIYLGNNDFKSVPPQLFSIPNLQVLILWSNPIDTVDAGISGMTKLHTLNLSETNLTAFPTAILSLDLVTLDLTRTPIGKLPDNISQLNELEYLYVGDTGLKKFPASLYDMTTLNTLAASNNEITSLSNDISGMTSLHGLYLDNNKLESLPNSICETTLLKNLDVSDNNLYSLPENIGDSGISWLSARCNRISSVPKSIGESANMSNVNLMVNRLTGLPSTFDDKTYEIVNVEFNFIDMSPGSPARTIIDNTNANYKSFEKQLKPVTGLIAVPSADSVALSWQPGEDGSDNFSEWDVKGYVVYQIIEGDLYKLADLNASTLQYSHTGLAPETEYTYRVGIDYTVDYPGYAINNYVTRGYTETEITTLPAPAASSALATTENTAPAATVPGMPAVSEQMTEAAEEAGAQPADAQPTGAQGLPIWAIVLICVVGVLALGAGGTLLVIHLKKGKAAPKQGGRDGSL